MRYKVDDIDSLESAKNIPKEQLAYHASDDMLILTGILGFFIGIVLVVIGRKGKQMYLWVWGAGLVIFSIYLSLSIWLDWTLFEYF